MRLVGFLCATLTLASCADSSQNGGATVASLVSPTPTVGAQISPQRLPMTNAVTIGCPLVPITSFDLIVLPSQAARVSVESVTIRLIDGTNLGGPMLTFSRPDLNRIFGSTLVVARRVYGMVEAFVEARPIDDLHLKGFNHPVLAMEIVRWREDVDNVVDAAAAARRRKQ